MNKRTLAAMLFIMLLVLLTACSVNIVEEGSPFYGRMHRYQVDCGCNVYVDSVTGVCYLQYSYGYGGGITVMMDANGKPLIYKGE